jgi:hypothetical protein
MPRRFVGRGRTIALAVMVLAIVALGRGGEAARAQPGQQVIQLYPGWNNIAFLGPTQPVETALASIAGAYDAIYRFDAASQSWLTYDPSGATASGFSDFSQGAAYWIHMLRPATLTVGLAALSSGANDQPLLVGWNNYAQVAPTAPVPAALQPYGATYTVVWHWDAAGQRWQMYDPTPGASSDFQALVQGQAYFVRVVAPSPIAPGPAKSSCYVFRSYQPTIADVSTALSLASTNALTSDPSFQLSAIHISPDGGPQIAPPYIPVTVLKAVGWIESSWRQATYAVPRGSSGVTITSSSCAYGLMQILTGMQISGQPTARQQAIGTDYQANIAAGAQLLLAKWNMAPDRLPVYGRRDPHIIEDWYFALWAYHCYGDTCSKYNVHNNPDDPVLKWPRPMFGSPEQQNSKGAFTAADYPYQELVYGLVANPPVVDGAPLWPAIPVALPPHGSVGFPVPRNLPESSAHLDNGAALPVAPTPQTATPTPTPQPTSGR